MGVNATDIIFQLYTDKIDCKRNVEVNTGYQLKTNIINSTGDNDLVFQRDDDEFLRLDKANDNIVCSKEIVAGNSVVVDTAKKLTMRPSLEPSDGGDLNIFDIRNTHPVCQ